MKIRFSALAVKCLFVVSAVSMFTVSGCKKEKKKNEVKFNSIVIDGTKEVPANASTATGTLNATYDKDSKKISYTITFSGLNPIAMHFHQGDPGVSGGVQEDIAGPYTSPLVGTTDTLSVAKEVQLLAGKWYVNLHSSAYPGGEIRGQLVPN